MGNETDNDRDWSIQTPRLTIRRAKPIDSDIALLLELWTNPEVMKNVGFPSGLRTDADRIEAQLTKQPAGEYDCVLIASLNGTGELMGECKLGAPDKDDVAVTDIKLLPRYWGNRFGVEIKRALLDYLFQNTTCRQVKATPNKQNKASIKMQKAVGGSQTGEGVHKFPDSMADYTTDVPYVEYTVFREDWIGKHD
jgi:RimJ/RimL family protein N-acetyltransferase